MVGGTHWGRTRGCEEWVHCPWLTVNRINNTTKYIEWSFFWILCFFRELTNPYSTKFLVDKMVEPIGFPDGLDVGSLNKKEVKGVFEGFVLGCYKAQAAFSWDGEGCGWRFGETSVQFWTCWVRDACLRSRWREQVGNLINKPGVQGRGLGWVLGYFWESLAFRC